MEINIIGKNQPSAVDLSLRQTSAEFLTTLKALESNAGWDKKQDSPLQVWEREIENRIIAKGILELQMPFQTVFNFLSDPSFVTLINNVCQLFEVLYHNPENKVVHMIMSFPGPVSDREIVAVNTVVREGKKGYIGNRSCEYPFKQREGTVMAEVHASGFILQAVEGNRTRVTSISDIDPKGMIPGFIKNAVASKRVQFLLSLQQKIREKNSH